MNKKVAVFDLDDVIALTINGIIEIIWQNFHVKMKLEDFANFSFVGIPEISKRAKELEKLIRTHDFFKQRKTLPGAVEGIKILSQKYIIIISTARPKRFYKTSCDWCKEVDIDPYLKKLYCGDHKPDVILKEKAKIFIDDNPYEHEEMFILNHNLQQIVVDKPWNKNFHDKRVTRSCGWTKKDAWRPEKDYPTILELMM